MYYAVLGMAVGWITAFPAIRLGGIPVAYLLLAVAASCAPFLRRIQLDRLTVAIAFVLISAVLYVEMHQLLLQKDISLNVVARTFIGLLLFLLIVTTVVERRHITALMTWVMPFWFASQLVGIGQFLGLIEAIALPIALLPEDAFDDDEAISLETIRIFGLLGLPHVFGYGCGLLTLALFGVASLQRKGSIARPVFFLFAFVSFATTVLSAQRAAVWPVAAIVALWTILTMRGVWKLIVPAVIVLGVLGAFAWRMGTAGFEWIALERLVLIDIGADKLRLHTWAEGVRMVLADPLLGSAYDRRDVGVGIHNGFLRGWAQFGIVWLLLIMAAGALIFRGIVLASSASSIKVISLGMVLAVVANSLSHTLVVTINDLISWSFLALALVLTRITAAELPLPRSSESSGRVQPV